MTTLWSGTDPATRNRVLPHGPRRLTRYPRATPAGRSRHPAGSPWRRRWARHRHGGRERPAGDRHRHGGRPHRPGRDGRAGRGAPHRRGPPGRRLRYRIGPDRRVRGGRRSGRGLGRGGRDAIASGADAPALCGGARGRLRRSRRSGRCVGRPATRRHRALDPRLRDEGRGAPASRGRRGSRCSMRL